MRAFLVGSLLILPVAAIAGSCALGGFERIDETAPVPGKCQQASVPPPPDMSDMSDAGDAGVDEEFTVAIRKVRFIEQADGTALGFDLDRYCTCNKDDDDGPSCISPKKAEKLCDLEGGRDNQGPKMFSVLSQGLGGADVSKLYSDFAETGGWTLLFRIRQYNGLANDDQVRLDWYVSGGMAGGPKPEWQGMDEWPISASSLAMGAMNPDATLFNDPAAYVTENNLVASIPSGQLLLTGGNTRVDLRLTTGSFVAKIVRREGGGYELQDAMLSARIKIADVFKMISNYRTENGQAFCTDNLFYDSAKGVFCNLLDIQEGPAEPNKKCDALSMSFGFDAEPAKLGKIAPDSVVPGGCSKETDPALDQCDPF